MLLILKQLFRAAVLICAITLFAGCAATARTALNYRPGALVETLSSPISLSIHATDSSMGGHGYLIFRRPGQARLLILSPFGTTMMEAFVADGRITLVYPGQMTAYSGRFDELPAKGGLQGWRLMSWVMDGEPPGEPSLNGSVERTARQGFKEKLTFENGLVVSKVSPEGDQVYYDKYVVINGVPVATEVDMRNGRDDRVRMTLDEPEVNTPLEADAFTPRLEGYTVLPLSAVQGL